VLLIAAGRRQTHVGRGRLAKLPRLRRSGSLPWGLRSALDLECALSRTVLVMDDIAVDGGLTVAQMAELTGVSGHTLRYGERAGLIQGVARNDGNHRRYGDGDVEWVAFLLRLRETGMSITEMRRYAQLRARGPITVQARRDLLDAHRARLRERISRLRGHERALQDKIAVYEQISASNHQPRNG
jgi:DNA-binding transcriptional MerR regulator